MFSYELFYFLQGCRLLLTDTDTDLTDEVSFYICNYLFLEKPNWPLLFYLYAKCGL